MPYVLVIDIGSLLTLNVSDQVLDYKINSDTRHFLSKIDPALFKSKQLLIKILASRPKSALASKWTHVVKKLPDGNEYLIQLKKVFNLLNEIQEIDVSGEDVIIYREEDGVPQLDNFQFNDSDEVTDPSNTLLISSDEKLIDVAKAHGCQTIASFAEAIIDEEDVRYALQFQDKVAGPVRMYIDVDETLLDCVLTMKHNKTVLHGPVVMQVQRFVKIYPQAELRLLTARIKTDGECDKNYPTSVVSVMDVFFQKTGINIIEAIFTQQMMNKVDVILDRDKDKPGLNVLIDDNCQEILPCQHSPDLQRRVIPWRVYREGNFRPQHYEQSNKFVAAAKMQVERQSKVMADEKEIQQPQKQVVDVPVKKVEMVDQTVFNFVNQGASLLWNAAKWVTIDLKQDDDERSIQKRDEDSSSEYEVDFDDLVYNTHFL